MNTDPIADLLTRIRNAEKAQKGVVVLPYSRIKFDICKILENQKSIHLHSNIDEKTSFLVVLDKINKTFVMIGLRYENSTDIIQGKCTIFE